MVYRMFFLCQNFVPGLICTLKNLKTCFQKTWLFSSPALALHHSTSPPQKKKLDSRYWHNLGYSMYLGWRHPLDNWVDWY